MMSEFSRNKTRFPTDNCPSRTLAGALELAIAAPIINARNQSLDKWRTRQNIVDLFVEYRNSNGGTFHDPIDWPETTDANHAIRCAAQSIYDRAYREKLIINQIISKIYE